MQGAGAGARGSGDTSPSRWSSPVLDLIDEAVLLGALEGTVIFCNRAATALYGWPAEGLVGRNLLQVALADVANDECSAILDRVLKADGWRGETRAWRRDGTVFPTAVSIAPLRDASGTVVSLVCVASDLTRRRELEQQLRHAQKMEAMGQIAGGVAHDFNNLLTAMRGYTELALDSLSADSSVRADVERVATAVHRASTLVRQFLTLARRSTPDTTLLDLNAVVSDLLRLVSRVIGDDIELTLERGHALWPVRADRSQMDQVVLNLVINARDALPGGGTLWLSTRNVTLAEGHESFGLKVRPGDYVVLEVRDSGSGMHPATLARMFEPFYTTKEQGRGSGLGLATVYGIVRQAHGTIDVQSAPQRGSRFTIYWPRAVESRRQARRSQGTAGVSYGGTETVLLVEDDEQVRRIAERVLLRLGYRVLTARSMDGAQDVAREHPDPIHLLLTDVVLTGSSGVELAARLAPARPAMQILYMSGYADAAAPRLEPLPRGARFLAKPFTPETLARTVRDVLDASTGHADP